MDGEAIADFQLQLSYELWDDVFRNNNVNCNCNYNYNYN